MTSLKEFEDCWALTESPNMSNIRFDNGKENSIFVQRSVEMNLVLEKIQRWSNLNGGKVALIGGAPGVGKTTFVKAIGNQLDNFYYISLFDYSPAIYADNNIEITSSDLITLFSRIENVVYESYLKFGTRTVEDRDVFSHSPFQGDVDDMDVAQQLIRDRVDTLAEWVSSSDEIIYLAIDNLDYLAPRDQFRICLPLFWLSRKSPNLVIMISGRPFLSVISDIAPRQLVGSSSESLCFLNYIDVASAVNARFEAVRIKGAKFEPFYDESGENFLREYCDGNIAMALKITAKLYLNAPSALSLKSPTYDRDAIIAELIGDSLANTDSRVSDSSFGFMPNILTKFKNNDRIPPFLHAISLLKKSRFINEAFCDDFRNTMLDYDPTSPKYSNSDIYEIIVWLRSMRVLRRVGVSNITALESYLVGKIKSGDGCFEVGISSTGQAVCSVSKTLNYRDAAQYFSLPTGYRNYIESIDFRNLEIHESLFWT